MIGIEYEKIAKILRSPILFGALSNCLAREAHTVPSVAYPKITIKESVMRINGEVVWLGDTFEKWKGVLPGAPRCFESKKDITLCVWDELGMELGSDLNDVRRVEFVNVKLKHRQKLRSPFENPWEPKGVFKGK